MLLSKSVEGFLLEFSLRHAASTAYRAYQPPLRHLIRRFGDQPIENITQDMLKQFMHYLVTEYIPDRNPYSTRKGTLLSGSAIDNHWKALRSFFRWAFENKLINSNPASNLARPRFAMPEIKPFTEDEVKRLIKAAVYSKRGKVGTRRKTAKRNLALLLLMLDTGLRLGEVLRLKAGDISLDAREIYIAPYGTGRKTKSRVIPISKNTALALWHYLSQNDIDFSRPLFTLTPRSTRSLLQRFGKVASVPHVHPHRFRHTFAIEYLRNGGDIFTLQRILGHSSLQMVQRYLHIAQTDIQSAHRRASPVDNWRL